MSNTPEHEKLKQWLSDGHKWLEGGKQYVLEAVSHPVDFFVSCLHAIVSVKTFLFLVLLVAVYKVGGCGTGRELTKFKNDFSKSNDVWNAERQTFADNNQKLTKSFDDFRQTNEAIIINLKTDFNETKRENDAEILKLTEEKNDALQRANMFETMPSNVLSIYNNIAATGTNFSQLSTLLSSLPSEMSKNADVPSFDFYINGTQITNSASVILTPSRKIFVQVANNSDATLEGLTITYTAQMDDTNLIRIHDWEYRGRSELSIGVPNSLGINVWLTRSTQTFGSHDYFAATAFQISTNVSTLGVTGCFKIYSNRSKSQLYMALIVFADGPILTNASPYQIVHPVQ